MSSATANAYLLKASATGDIQRATLALQHGADPNCVDKFGQRPILSAAQRCDHNMVQFLMKRGSDPRCLSGDRMFPMALAAVGERIDVMDAMGVHCWDTESPSALEPSALEHALLAGRDLPARHLIHHGADIEASGQFGETLLMRMAAVRNDHAVALLLEEGALWFSIDDKGLSAIDYARHMGHRFIAWAVMVQAMAEPLIDPDRPFPRAIFLRPRVSAADARAVDFEALETASEEKDPNSDAHLGGTGWDRFRHHLRILRSTVRWNLDNLKVQLQWVRPHRWARLQRTRRFIAALRAGDLHKAKAIWTDGPILPNARDWEGCPLTVLVARALSIPDSEAHTDPADSPAEATQKRTALMVDLLEALSDSGAKPFNTDARGTSVGHALLEGPHSSAFLQLMDRMLYTETLNRSNARLDRPLHLATRRRDLRVIEGLLARGCDRNPVNKDGHAPLHHCALHVDADIAGVLINAGANLLLKTRRGQTLDAIIRSVGQRAADFDALIKARKGIEKVMSIFSPGNPMAAAARTLRPKPTEPPNRPPNAPA